MDEMQGSAEEGVAMRTVAVASIIILQGVSTITGTFAAMIGVDTIATENWGYGVFNLCTGAALLAVVAWSMMRMWKYWERTP